jgi:hypothetical protein
MLPKIDLPMYELKLPSSGKTVTFRPFLVKEEKLLLMAVKSDDPNEIINTTKQVINNCLINSDINLDTIPFFDIDCLFIALRAKSVGESIDVNYVCQNKVDDQKCGGQFPVKIDISNVTVDKKAEIGSEIKFNDKLIFYMKYPNYSVIRLLNTDDDSLEKKIKIIAASVEKIFANEQYYTSKDLSPKELQDFIEGLTQEQFNKLADYIANFPTFFVKAEGVCPKCGKNHTVRYKDFMRFFQ